MIRLTRREKLLVAASVIFIVAWSLFTFVFGPAFDRIQTLNRLIPQKQDELRKLTAASREYIFLRDSLKQFSAKAASQQDDFQLLPFLESLVQRCRLEKKVVTMKQQVLPLSAGFFGKSDYYETIVEIRFQNLMLSQLVDFLRKVESSGILANTRTLHIVRNPTNKDLLDSVIQIHNATPHQLSSVASNISKLDLSRFNSGSIGVGQDSSSKNPVDK